jgi:hypothetical protein
MDNPVAAALGRAAFTISVICLALTTHAERAQAAALSFTTECTGPFTGAVDSAGPPIILSTSGSGPCGGSNGLTSLSFTHSTSIPDLSGPPFALQTIFGGTADLGGEISATYTGTFQLNDSDTGGTIDLTLALTGVSGIFAGRTGTGTATGTALLVSQFDGAYDLTINGVLVPEPGTWALMATGLILLGGMRQWTRRATG